MTIYEIIITGKEKIAAAVESAKAKLQGLKKESAGFPSTDGIKKFQSTFNDSFGRIRSIIGQVMGTFTLVATTAKVSWEIGKKIGEIIRLEQAVGALMGATNETSRAAGNMRRELEAAAQANISAITKQMEELAKKTDAVVASITKIGTRELRIDAAAASVRQAGGTGDPIKDAERRRQIEAAIITDRRNALNAEAAQIQRNMGQMSEGEIIARQRVADEKAKARMTGDYSGYVQATGQLGAYQRGNDPAAESNRQRMAERLSSVRDSLQELAVEEIESAAKVEATKAESARKAEEERTRAARDAEEKRTRDYEAFAKQRERAIEEESDKGVKAIFEFAEAQADGHKLAAAAAEDAGKAQANAAEALRREADKRDEGLQGLRAKLQATPRERRGMDRAERNREREEEADQNREQRRIRELLARRARGARGERIDEAVALAGGQAGVAGLRQQADQLDKDAKAAQVKAADELTKANGWLQKIAEAEKGMQ